MHMKKGLKGGIEYNRSRPCVTGPGGSCCDTVSSMQHKFDYVKRLRNLVASNCMYLPLGATVAYPPAIHLPLKKIPQRKSSYIVP